MWRLWVGAAFAVWFAFGYYTGQWVHQQRTPQDQERRIARSLAVAQRTADQIVEEAKVKAKAMVAEAEARAIHIIKEHD